MELKAQLVQAMQPLIFRNRTRLTPAQLQELVERLTQDYQAALQQANGQPEALAQDMAQRGLHPEMIFAVAEVLYAHGYAQGPDIGRATGAYLRRLMTTFIAHRERLLKQELEASLQAQRRLTASSS